VSYGGRRVGTTLLALAVILIVVLLLLMPPTQDLLKRYLVDPFSPHYPEQVSMEISRTITLDANGGSVIDYQIAMPVPKDVQEDGVLLQSVNGFDTYPAYDGIWDNGSYDSVFWNGGDITGSISINITTTVTQTLHVWDMDKGNVLNKSEVPQYMQDRYLDDEWTIVVNDPQVQQLSDVVVGDESNVYAIARAIYDWMQDNVNYYVWTDQNEPLTSLQTMDRLKGDCDDQSILFCALARAAGVPAWLQLGAIYDRSSGSMGGHAWVQMYMPTSDGGTNVTIDVVNDNFLIWMPNLFCEYTDTGNETDLWNAYHSISVHYDPSSYPPTKLPEVTYGWNVIGYEESEGTVVLEAATREGL